MVLTAPVVQRAQHQVPGFGASSLRGWSPHAQLADQNHIGPQHRGAHTGEMGM
jgi:hypothetical protein